MTTDTRYLVVDLEATCDDRDFPPDQQEIIEIGAVLVEDESFQIVAEFATLVRPTRRPDLTDFCTELTGIRQHDVDSAPEFPDAWAAFIAFVRRSEQSGFDVVFCSWGAYDRKQFDLDLGRWGLQAHFDRHLNLKAQFAENRGLKKQVGMAKALELMGFPLSGRHHRGIDDARNIAKLLPFALPAVSVNAPGS